MIKIDAQVHAYEHNHPGRPWAAALHWPAAVTGDDMIAAMRARAHPVSDDNEADALALLHWAIETQGD